MNTIQSLTISKHLLTLLGNLYELERKLILHGDPGHSLRNVRRMKDVFAENFQIFYEDPMGQTYDETRTDLDASISGSQTQGLVVIEVIKPIVRAGNSSYSIVVQKGIVVVSAPAEDTNK